jgi:hypothetical protein
MTKPKPPDPTLPSRQSETTIATVRSRWLPQMAGDPDAHLALLVDVQTTIANYRLLERDLIALVVSNLPPMKRKETYHVPALGRSVEVTPPSTKRTYDNPRLSSAIVEALPPLANADGEDIRQQVVDDLLAITGATTPSYNSWRINALKALGIDPYRYVTDEVRGTPGLIIRKDQTA